MTYLHFYKSNQDGNGVMPMNSQVSEILRHFEEAHKEDIEVITQVLARITTLSPEQIKPYLDTMLERLVKPQAERPLYETATPFELSQAFREWADSHDRNTPLLSDYAVSRESMYSDEE
ncbi:hypothetical protein Cylst_6534 (plasmid) [Cylindrospermum stagnale PCC 7417]|uniref:Uncharacterized protein n=1 Tax=Cylindrospermum stagnale PCC 7417 TaxID=56107 RepID=K9X746_9NOST|nr:hypothetical protein Cylst_6534 [Cylindrospermum stagnale PCC 7417]